MSRPLKEKKFRAKMWINERICKAVLLSIFFCQISHAQPAEAWEKIFNGKNIDGWSVVDPPVNVKVLDSSMVLHMTAHTARHSFIRTNRKYKDFIFEVDFRRDRTIDSGILFRSEATPDSAFSRLFGYMVKIDPSLTRMWTGGVFLDFGNGLNWLHPLQDDARARNSEKSGGGWNRVRIEAVGNEIKVWVNGIPTSHLIDDKYQSGFIALKIHYLGGETEKEKLEIAYKNMRVISKNVKRYAREIDLPAKSTIGKNAITYFR